MNTALRHNTQTKILTAGSIVLLMIAAEAALGSKISLPADLLYFQGKWTITVKADPSATFTWTASEDLKGEWLAGVVEKGGSRVSTDIWRVNAGIIERYIFTNDGVFIKVVSSGWKSGKLVLSGIGNGKAIDFRVRETITRISDNKFRAVWERQSDDGKWAVFSDETCVK
jgi:hypothetical protein